MRTNHLPRLLWLIPLMTLFTSASSYSDLLSAIYSSLTGEKSRDSTNERGAPTIEDRYLSPGIYNFDAIVNVCMIAMYLFLGACVVDIIYHNLRYSDNLSTAEAHEEDSEESDEEAIHQEIDQIESLSPAHSGRSSRRGSLAGSISAPTPSTRRASLVLPGMPSDKPKSVNIQSPKPSRRQSRRASVSGRPALPTFDFNISGSNGQPALAKTLAMKTSNLRSPAASPSPSGSNNSTISSSRGVSPGPSFASTQSYLSTIRSNNKVPSSTSFDPKHPTKKS